MTKVHHQVQLLRRVSPYFTALKNELSIPFHIQLLIFNLYAA